MKFSELNKNISPDPIKKEIAQTIKKENKIVQSENKIVEDKDKKEDIKDQVMEQNKNIISEKNKSIKEENKIENRDEMRFTIKPKISPQKENFSAILERKNEFIERAKMLYSRSLIWIKDFFAEVERPYLEKYVEAYYIINDIYKEIDENPFFPLMLKYITPGNYLFSHSLNVAIIGIGAAKSLNFSEDKIKHIGIAGLFHDIGMMEYIYLARKEGKLNSGEMDLIKNHVIKTLESLDKIMDFDPKVKPFISDIILKTHERIDGSGYPQGISELDIYSGIIASADVYEAMTHMRPYRDAYEFPLLIRNFIGEFKNLFPSNSLKGILSFLTMYPAGSIVRLSTGEIGIVEILNKRNFSRPLVKVVMDGDFNIIENFYIDLTEYPLSSIEDMVSYKEISQKNNEFLVDFQMQNLWVDW